MDFTLTKDELGFDLRGVLTYLMTLNKGVYKVTIKRIRNQRTNQQNKYLWGCVYPIIFSCMNNDGWEFTSHEQLHYFLLQQHSKRKIINNHTGEIIEFGDSSSEMNTVEFFTYVDTLRELCRLQYEVEIPEPNINWKEEQK